MVPKKNEVPWYWNLADELRSHRIGGDWFLGLVREAKARGLIHSWRDVSALARVDERAAELLDPPVVVDFIVALYSDSAPGRILDPWAGMGITLWGLDEAGLVETGVGIEINPDVHELARELNPSTRMQWLNDNAVAALPTLSSDFDLVVGSPPMGLPLTTLLTSGTEVRSSATLTMLVQASRQLGDEGQMAVILPESFFGEDAAPVHEALARGSVWPSASFALPARAFRTTVSTSVVVFERREPEALFVAELDPSVEIGALVSNFRNRRASKVPQLGQLVPKRQFRTWTGYTRDLEIQRLAAEGALRPIPLTEVCTAIRRARSDGTFVESPTSVYLPNVGTSRAATSVHELTVKPHNVLELEIDPSIADPSYVAGFFNSTLGRLTRDQWSSGTAIQHITLASARSATLYLPPSLETQRRAVEVDRSLRELRRGVDALQRRVWEMPVAVGTVEQELRRLTEGDGLDRWMESLPFPLASILWQYHGADTAESRCNFLVNFFEAATLFLVDLHWSALHEQMPIGSADEGSESTRQPVTFERGSIGIWATLLAQLAKTARRLLGDQAPLALDLYRVRDQARLQGIADKALMRALKEEAAQFRIDWVAHTAPASEGVWEQRLSLAEDTLTRIRVAIGEAFDGWRLVRTGAGRRRNGVVTTSIEDLTGSRMPFRRTQADLRELPEEGRLYMLEEGSSLPLELGPLVQLRRAPEAVEDACYFYDRIEGGSVKFISYHYPHEPALLPATPRTSPTPTPSATAGVIGPDSVARVVTTDLVIRSAPGLGADSEIYSTVLDEPTLLYVVDGPVGADGYDWYLVQPFEASLEDVSVERPFGWVAAGDRTGAQDWIARASLECPSPTVEDIRWMAPEARLACFGSEELVLDGRFGGCFVGETPVWLQVQGCALLPVEAISSEALDPGPFRLRFVDAIDIPHDQPDALVTVSGHFDHPEARSCAWNNAFSDEMGGAGPSTPPMPEEVILWCRTEFVATDIAVAEGH